VIRFVTRAGEDLLLPAASISLEMANPYFETDAIPGTTSYAFDVPATGENPRRLGFPHLFRGPGGPPPVPVDCYLDGLRWKRGSIVYRGYDAKKRTYRVNFVADATDLATQLAALQLPELVLPDLVFARDGSAAGYVLAPVRNAAFFDDKNPAFTGILNYPTPAGVLTVPSAGQVYAPMLYLVPVVRQVLATLGWTVTGTWVDDEEMQTAVIYSDRALPADLVDGDTFNPARHLPTMSVAELLLAVQNYFCLGLYFQADAQELRITPLREAVVRGGYVDRPGAVLTTAGTNETQGFALKLRPDTTDELDKTLDVSWQEKLIGAGQETITVGAGTLHMVEEEDPNVPGRLWLLPAISAKGASADYELGEDSRTGLRLLFDRGACPDSRGDVYRLVSAGTLDYEGNTVGTYSLRWDGADGLYAQWHQPWLDFRARAVPREYEVPLRIGELLTLDPATHEQVDYHRLLWQKVRLSVSAGSRLQSATFSYQELL
jgi:hypothetical protein